MTTLKNHRNNKPYSQLSKQEKVKAAADLHKFLVTHRLKPITPHTRETKSISNQVAWMKRKLLRTSAVILTKDIPELDRLWMLEIGGKFFVSIVSDTHNEDFVSILAAATGTKHKTQEITDESTIGDRALPMPEL